MPSPQMIARNGNYLLIDRGGSGAIAPISDNDPMRGTYSTFLTNVVPAASPTDILTIQGSKSKIIRLRQIIVTGVATAASNVQIFITKRSTSNTGGTSAPQSLVAHDSLDDPASAVLALYTANPTGLGTSLGVTDGGRLNLAPAANGGIDRLLFQYGWLNDKAPLLNGPNEYYALGLAGSAMPAGGSFDISVNISED